LTSGRWPENGPAEKSPSRGIPRARADAKALIVENASKTAFNACGTRIASQEGGNGTTPEARITMTIRPTSFTAIGCGLLLALSVAAPTVVAGDEKGSSALRLVSSRVSLAGTSNIHAYTATTGAARLVRVDAATSGAGADFWEAIVKPGALEAFEIAIPAAGAVAQNDATVTAREHAGVYGVTATSDVPQPAELTMATLTDYPAIPRYMPEVRSSLVLTRADARATVEQEAVARFMMFSKRVHLVLDVEEGRDTVRFRDRCGRSFARYEGVWTITERAGRTQVTYELSAQPAFDVPAFILTRLLERDASQMIERLKAEIDTRARHSGQ
jgi:hypothetical protein